MKPPENQERAFRRQNAQYRRDQMRAERRTGRSRAAYLLAIVGGPVVGALTPRYGGHEGPGGGVSAHSIWLWVLLGAVAAAAVAVGVYFYRTVRSENRNRL